MSQREDVLANLLEFAANNDVNGFKKWGEFDPSRVDEPGLWYGRQKKGSKKITLLQRTPLMMAATYGSIDVLKLILSLNHPIINPNQSCGPDNTTALHCAASSGSPNAIEIVKMLLAAGADPNLTDAMGHRPIDVITGISSHPILQETKLLLQTLLSGMLVVPPEQKKKYAHQHPSLPDIGRNSIYSSDEFRMYLFKVQPCTRAYAHAWTDCPFAHPGENARRRDPRKYHYSCLPCANFRNGSCLKGDMCEFGHGVFECWLHPAQYRTRMCKDGGKCVRRVCFFAHSLLELRHAFYNVSSYCTDPRSGGAVTFLSASSSSVSAMPTSRFTHPMFPGSSNMISDVGPNQALVHHPRATNNLIQSSTTLKQSTSARGVPTEDDIVLPDNIDDLEQILLDEFSSLSQPNMSATSVNPSAARSKSLEPSNFEDLFSGESSWSSHGRSHPATMAAPAAVPQNQFQHQPARNNTGSPSRNVHHPFGVPSSFGMIMMPPQSMESISPVRSGWPSSELVHHQNQMMRSLSSRELGSNSTAVVGSPMQTRVSSSENIGRQMASNSPLGTQNNHKKKEDLSWVYKFEADSVLEQNEADQDRTNTSTAVPQQAAAAQWTNLNYGEFDSSAVNALLDDDEM